MQHKFPMITHINDVLPALEGRDEFVIAERKEDRYTVINYNVAFQDTFDIDVSEGYKTQHGEYVSKGVMRRECRGIIFDNNGNLISRPYAKFFNVGEKIETDIKNIDISKPHIVLDKLDGSFIRPFRTNDGIFRVGTKMGETDIAEMARPFFDKENYRQFANWCLDRHLTPIFEFMSQKNRIVIDYGDVDSLILTTIRDNYSGNYIKYH